MPIPDSVLIVGASVAGVGVANELRREGYEGRVTLVDAQRHAPYDRPPLSKAYLTKAELPTVDFHDARHWEAARIELRTGQLAVALDAPARSVRFADGSRVAAGAIVLCTGAAARRLSPEIATAPVWTIRDLDDAVSLRAALLGARSVAIIGGGFIGAEVASGLRGLGKDVTVIDVARLPFERVLGAAVAERVMALHEAAGIQFRLGAGVHRIEETAEGRRILLDDGSAVVGDLVIAGLGAVVNDAWLEGAGLARNNGIICDTAGRTSAPGIWAAGDIAAWQEPSTGKPVRHEHWTSAREQARIVAHSLLDREAKDWSRHVPYFWSDIEGHRIQMLGEISGGEEVQLVWENPEKSAFLYEYRRRGKVVAVAGCNAAVRLVRYQPQLVAGLSDVKALT